MNFQISLIDVVDVSLVAVVIYFALRLIRGTRAEQMLIGLTVLFVIYELSKWFGLLTVEWVFSQFFSAFIIIFVVLFQHEIRRGLMRVAVNPLGSSGVPMDQLIEQLVESSLAMVHQGWGALIVIERETGLKHLMDSGVEMNAPLRADVVQALFCPKAPMHDGAIVVRADASGGRIVAARVLLPLAQATALQGEFGTRHRAAVGLSEESDAVIVVVSEERRDLRLVREGRLSKAYDAQGLRRALNEALEGNVRIEVAQS
ncbi:MAG: hypothetical protein CO186_08070 [Zetaproteobacteria bacterium CG_4_9_14_3_um_filter_49_83]|nr:MAG: hypothetical protein AUJ56_08280 [Zetaproteobacteria bacterium CG1_02_49_23]PIQ34078.1 MAG: hypothetical protein COW62_03270 [Zetaproteobacteria bacterium CG17_big_fil_post_rev_8_21_14_2_50_50_13]PIV30245.1 MAG: hypothetical protein COS35_07855 [Zetaproteobacteria bacterium CG02_land_8_20_14_3_00_50_9]PIY55874.1 MAG: hypothetical protein COZ00_07070 [Zetaproteobacteria bacterium CG_4_10_14_0_8_um_filter_49_80]PJA35004.1 MAG: hypothetical protein CO186_08070 [Zetaproteobacteria bacterium